MKIFVHTVIIIATLALGSVASADAKTLVITGRVVELGEQWIIVQSGKERLEIGVRSDIVKYIGKPKVGDTVTVHYKPFKQFRFDPDYDASKIEVIAAGGSKK